MLSRSTCRSFEKSIHRPSKSSTVNMQKVSIENFKHGYELSHISRGQHWMIPHVGAVKFNIDAS